MRDFVARRRCGLPAVRASSIACGEPPAKDGTEDLVGRFLIALIGGPCKLRMKLYKGSRADGGGSTCQDRFLLNRPRQGLGGLRFSGLKL